MASPTIELQNFAQSIYLVVKGRSYDEIEGDDGQTYIGQVIDWTNMFLDELESETGPDGEIVNWYFARSSGYNLGTAALDATSIPMKSGVDRLIADEERYVQITVDGTVVSNWAVAQAGDIPNKPNIGADDMCAMVGTTIVFSRPFREVEVGGTITGDVILSIPRLSRNSVSVLNFVKPGLLLKLGVAKNMSLPDIVQGGLSPSYVQKFNDLLTGAIAKSSATSVAKKASRDSYGGVGGQY